MLVVKQNLIVRVSQSAEPTGRFLGIPHCLKPDSSLNLGLSIQEEATGC